jgi:hypothetical protein
LRPLYVISVDRTGALYCGLTLKWDYSVRRVDVSMPDYIHKVLHKIKHPPFTTAQDAPHKWNEPMYDLPNGLIYITAKILRNVMGSTAEVKIGASFLNGQEAIPIRNTLMELCHPQPPTPMQVDNTLAVGFSNGTIKQKRLEAIDMGFYWIGDRTRQGQFLIYWRPGKQNLGDYHSKHHSPAYHHIMRPTYLHTQAETLANSLFSVLLQGCINRSSHARAHARHNPTHYRQNPETTQHRTLH